jgi:dimethylglycine dehydrogenase
VQRSLALGYVPKEYALLSGGFEIEILGERCKATPLAAAPFDPAGARMRA